MATKARSPNYPQISLPKAIELTSKLYEKAHTHKASATVVVGALGYTGLNGKSIGVISALKKYGLLEAVADNEFKISKDGLVIIVDPKASVERAAAIMRAAFQPTLFAELRQEYGDTPPKSDDFLRAFLLKRGFVQSVVDVPIRTYRDTMALVQEAKQVMEFDEMEELINTPVDDMEDSNMDATAALVPAVSAARAASVAPSPSAWQRIEEGFLDDTYRLPDGRAFVLRWPATMTSDEYEDFEAWITLLQRKLKRAIQQ